MRTGVHYLDTLPQGLNFRMFTANIWVSRFFRIFFTVYQQYFSHDGRVIVMGLCSDGFMQWRAVEVQIESGRKGDMKSGALSAWPSWLLNISVNNDFVSHINTLKIQMNHSTTEPTKWPVHPAKTRISLGIHPIWSVFAVRSVGSLGPMVSSCGQRRLFRLGRSESWLGTQVI